MARKIGLRFGENMYGHHEMLEGPAAGRRLRFDFRYEVETRDLLRSLRDGRGEATGWVEAEGLAAHAGLVGSFEIAPFVRRYVRYEFEFTDDEGRRHRYVGQKTIRWLHPARTLTTMPGAILDRDGKPCARTLSRFRFRELLPFLFSFRPTLVEG